MCSYEWIPRTDNPKECPKCKRMDWNIEKELVCKVCGRGLITPIIHHIDGNHKNDKKSNRITLCTDCHIAIHFEMGSKSKGRKGKRRDYMNNIEVIEKIEKLQSKLNKEKNKWKQEQNLMSR